jgi:uncharacterized protein (TIGR02284 family)
MMTTSKDPETVEVLDHLLVLCADGAYGYQHAAAAVKDPAIHRFLAKSAAVREEIVAVLTNTLVSIGYKPSHHGSIPGAIHRRWIDVIGALSSDATDAVLRECERGEHETIVAFTSALGRPLPEDVRAVVRSQLGRILETNATLHKLADSEVAAS